MRKKLVLLVVVLSAGCAWAGEMSTVDVARRMRPLVWEHVIFDSAEHFAEVMLKCNANAVRFNCISQNGNYVNYNSEFFPKHPALGDRDLMQELADEFKKHDDLHLFPYNSFGYFINDTVAAGKDPDWRQTNADGSYKPMSWCDATGYWVCLNNPGYVNNYAAACKEVVQKYDVSGMYFDGPRWGWGGHCYCQFCKKFVKETFSIEPDNDALDKHRFEIRKQGFEYSMRTITEAIKSVKNIPVLYNHGMHKPDMYGLMEFTDGGLVAEVHRKGPMSLMNIFKLVKAGGAFDRARWAYSPPGNYNDYVTYDNLDPTLFGMLELSHGGTPIVETMHPYMYDETGIPAIRRMYDIMEAHEDLFFTYRPVAYMAMPFSKQNVSAMDHYDTFWRGSLAALTHAHHQFNAVLDEDLTLEKLRKYKVLFLTNMGRMSDRQIAAVKAYVKQGGGLVATYQTSLYDEKGESREDFGLKELFRADFEGFNSPGFKHAYGPAIYVQMAQDHPITAGIGKGKRIANDYVFASGALNKYVKIAPLEGAEVIAGMQHVVDDPEWRKEGERIFVGPYVLEDGPAGIVAGTYGKGRVVYIAPALEFLYDFRGFSTVRKLLSNAVEWAAGGERVLDVAGPSSLVANLTEKGDKRALHLINHTGNNHENGLYKVEWVAPLYDIEATIQNPPGKKLKKATLLTTGKKIKHKRKGDYATVTIPEIDVYECVMLHYR
jgi:hypothetical protein